MRWGMPLLTAVLPAHGYRTIPGAGAGAVRLIDFSCSVIWPPSRPVTGANGMGTGCDLADADG